MSKKYATVKKFYDLGMWTTHQVRNAVVKSWITEEEFVLITGEEY